MIQNYDRCVTALCQGYPKRSKNVFARQTDGSPFSYSVKSKMQVIFSQPARKSKFSDKWFLHLHSTF